MYYDPLKVVARAAGDFPASWGAPDGARFCGTQHFYDVTDENFERSNFWKFIVQVPYATYKRRDIVVQPALVPPRPALAGLTRRNIVYPQGSIGAYADKHYCKVNLADSSGEKNRIGVRKGERSGLPVWLQQNYFRGSMRLKKTVADTRGTDHNSQVVVLNPEDHTKMIRIFFAARVWLLL